MILGESHDDQAAPWGRPLDGVRILALEQMQVLPFATQMLARLGADVIKVETPGRGDSGRASRPSALLDPDGEPVGPTFIRNNLGKRSIAIDVASDSGRQLVIDLAGAVDVVCENLGPGRADRFGLGYEVLGPLYPRLIYLSISGFGSLDDSPYQGWPAYGVVAEAMTGMYEYSRQPNQPPIMNPLGGIGDSGTGLYSLVGLLAALRHRDRTDLGQFIDVAMFDAMLSLLDLAYNFSSLGIRNEPDNPKRLPLILDPFRAADGWVVLQVARPHQFERLARFLDHPEWVGDPRFADGGWVEAFEPVVRPALEGWAADKSILEAATALADQGLAAAPCYAGQQVAGDEHVKRRRMVVELPRYDGVDDPVLVAGNPLKMTRVAEGPDGPLPGLGQHTDAVLAELLGLGQPAIDELHRAGVVAGPATGSSEI